MAGETPMTIVGNLTSDPELRFTPSGAAVAKFTIASTPRNFDKNSGEFKDGETLFVQCQVWREAAENAAETLTKGMSVVAHGNYGQRNYETKEGEKRTSYELQVTAFGPNLVRASAKVTKNAPKSGGNSASSAPAASVPNSEEEPPF
jgi:single-strand DNA-binding protein